MVINGGVVRIFVDIIIIKCCWISKFCILFNVLCVMFVDLIIWFCVCVVWLFVWWVRWLWNWVMDLKMVVWIFGKSNSVVMVMVRVK